MQEIIENLENRINLADNEHTLQKKTLESRLITYENDIKHLQEQINEYK